MKTPWPQVPAEVEERFLALADQQRDAPERAMDRIQHSQIAQLYGYVAEHTGDLIHRMSERINRGYGQHATVLDKVDRVLPKLTASYGFEREVRNQIERNYRYHLEGGILPKEYTSPQRMLEILRELGRQYAEAHGKLPTYNKAQALAKAAAVAIGLMEFENAIVFLRQLKKMLDKGPRYWATQAMVY